MMMRIMHFSFTVVGELCHVAVESLDNGIHVKTQQVLASEYQLL